VLEVMAQPWCGDLYGWRPDAGFVDAINRSLPRLEVAVWTRTGVAGLEPHPQAVHAVERAATLLQDLGHTVREVALPAGCDEQVRQALHHWFAASVNTSVSPLVPVERRELLLPYTRYLLEEGAALTASDVLAAQGVLARYASSFLAALDTVDIAVTPTTSGPPVPIGHFGTDGVEGIEDLMLAWSCYTPWVNFTGQPAVSLPTHLDSDGLPYGVQLVGRRQRDDELLALAAQLERAGLWNDIHPPCWDQ
jgi:amidase